MILTLAAALASGPAAAAGWPAGTTCLSTGDTYEIVAERKIVAPPEAMGLAHKAVPNAEVLRASLCREHGRLVYVATLIQKGGRLMRVSIDAHTGAVNPFQ